jgi:two-component system sensor histidine kinase YesM
MKLNGYSFRNKLILSFIFVSLLPILIVQVISYYVSNEAMKDKINVLVQSNLLQTSKNLDTSIEAYEDIVQQIITNDELIELINVINQKNGDMEPSKSKLVNMLASYSYAKNGIRSVSIFTKNGAVFSYDRQTGSPYYNLWSDISEPTELPLYKQTIDYLGTLVTEPEAIDTINSKELFGFHVARKINDYNRFSLEGIGIVVVTIYESVLAEAINLGSSGSNATNSIDSLNYLVNGAGQIVSSPDKLVIGENITDTINASTIYNVFSNPKSGLQIYNLIDQRKLFHEMFVMRRLNITIGVFALLLTGILIFFFSGRLSASIRNIVRAMKAAQYGALNVQLENHHTKDEISHIAINFNRMMSRINELMAETKEATEKQKNAEIRALEAQINPHFLYNTLDSINWIAIEKEEHQISQMLKGLAQILRYSIRDSNKRVTIKEELAWMERYIYLQQYRFQFSFICEVVCAEDIMHYRVPKLLLQPIIENAIIHGFEGLNDGGLIRIQIEQINDHLIRIEIQDNGTGMDEHTRNSLLTNGAGIGLVNVQERLEIYYGYQAKLDIASQLGEGTTVMMELPITQDEEGEG